MKLANMAACRSDVSMDEFLISEVREKYSYVYDFRDYRYRNRNLREKAWREIGVSIGIEAKDVSARWKTLRDKYVREKKKPKSGSGAAEKPDKSLHSLLGFLDDVVCARQTLSSLSENANSIAFVEEEADIDPEELNSESSVTPSPLPSAYSPLSLTPAPFPSPMFKCSSTINSSLPFPTPTSALSYIPIEPTTPQTTLEPSTPVHSSQRTSRKVSECKRKEEDLLAALIRSQPREMDECDLYCSSLAARLREMPRQDMAELRFKIEELLLEYARKNK